MIELSMFGFRALWSPYFIFFTAIALCGYLFITSNKREINKGLKQTSMRQKILFILGLSLFYFSLGGPLDLLGHLVFSAHMTQMAAAFILTIPLMMYGAPSWIYDKIYQTKVIGGIFRFLTKPLISLLLFNGFFSLYHLPLIFDVVKQSEALHATFLVVLTILSITMWWPLFHKLENEPQLEGIKKIGFIFANGMLLTPACALIIFATGPMYETYSSLDAWLQALSLCVPADVLVNLNLTTTDVFDWIPILEDQQLGGVIMKIMQEFVYGSLIAYVFFDLVKDGKKTVEEPLYVKQMRESREMS